MGNGLEGQKTFEFPQKKKPMHPAEVREQAKQLPGEQYQGLNKKVLDFILKLTLGKFYGKVILTFEAGEIKHVEERLSIKP